MSATSRIGGLAFFLSTAGVTGYLCVWQFQRADWKRRLLAYRASQLELPPVEFETVTSAQPIEEIEPGFGTSPYAYRRIQLEGRFVGPDMLVGPRSAPESSTALLPAGASSATGFYSFAPFQSKNGSDESGYVPLTLLQRYCPCEPWLG